MEISSLNDFSCSSLSSLQRLKVAKSYALQKEPRSLIVGRLSKVVKLGLSQFSFNNKLNLIRRMSGTLLAFYGFSSQFNGQIGSAVKPMEAGISHACD